MAGNVSSNHSRPFSLPPTRSEAGSTEPSRDALAARADSRLNTIYAGLVDHAESVQRPSLQEITKAKIYSPDAFRTELNRYVQTARDRVDESHPFSRPENGHRPLDFKDSHARVIALRDLQNRYLHQAENLRVSYIRKQIQTSDPKKTLNRGDFSTVINHEAPEILKFAARQIEWEISGNSEFVEIEKRLQPTSPEAEYVFEPVAKDSDTSSSKPWSTQKKIAVTALSISGAGLLALAVYLFARAQQEKLVAQQRPMIAAQPQARALPPQYANMQGQANLNTIGFNPSLPIPGMAPPVPASTFNPSPLYAYPVA